VATRLAKEWAGLPPDWRSRLSFISEEHWFQDLAAFLDGELAAGKRVFPPEGSWLRALYEVPYESVRVVILGQDPYHGAGQAMGIAFAVPNELKPKPPSLVNVFKEIGSDMVKVPDPGASDLSGWLAQGVLLLNTVLTVREGEPLSHRDRGWEKFTDQALSALNDRSEPLVFLLWGAPAQKKRALLTNPKHLVLEAPHPSPLSSYRGFFGCRHFTKANAFLSSQGKPAIEWWRTALALQSGNRPL
jgi:uracil-DNA glycosylase